MRRFVADASHELRTPLTSIRGFAELYRQGAVRSEEDVRRLMERIEAEGARMGMLVEDLLLLARLDQQRPLTFAPGRPGRDRRRRRPRREGRPAGPADRPAPGRVAHRRPGRAAATRAGCARSSATWSPTRSPTRPPARRVTVTVAQAPTTPTSLVLRVADEGPGMDPADADRAFERFYRADTSRTRAGRRAPASAWPSSSSLVAAHGGSVELETAPGRGRRRSPSGCRAPAPWACRPAGVRRGRRGTRLTVLPRSGRDDRTTAGPSPTPSRSRPPTDLGRGAARADRGLGDHHGGGRRGPGRRGDWSAQVTERLAVARRPVAQLSALDDLGVGPAGLQPGHRRRRAPSPRRWSSGATADGVVGEATLGRRLRGPAQLRARRDERAAHGPAARRRRRRRRASGA